MLPFAPPAFFRLTRKLFMTARWIVQKTVECFYTVVSDGQRNKDAAAAGVPGAETSIKKVDQVRDQCRQPDFTSLLQKGT